MQAGFINLKARKMGVTLFLEPVEVGDKNGRDFNARNVRQHQPGIIVIVIGHAHASFIGLFKDGNGEWFVAGVIDIPAGNAKMLRWSKDDDGTWFQTSTLAVLSPGIRLGLAG